MDSARGSPPSPLSHPHPPAQWLESHGQQTQSGLDVCLFIISSAGPLLTPSPQSSPPRLKPCLLDLLQGAREWEHKHLVWGSSNLRREASAHEK